MGTEAYLINRHSTKNDENANVNNTKSQVKDANDNEFEKVLEVVEEDTLDILLPSQIGTDPTFKRRVVWFNAIGFLVLHILGVIGLLTMILGYTKGLTTIYFYLLTFSSGMGITMGAHRLFSHRAFKAKTWLRVTLLIMHTMVGQNCLYVWVRDHRQHHKYSDTDADPHNATRGFFFSHIGWLMSRKHPKVIEYGKKIDMSDLEADPWVMFQKRYYKTLYIIFTILIPTSVPVYFWGESVLLATFATYLARTVLQLNITWCVNSVAHMFGSRPYDKTMLPVESKFVSFIGVGEGWHNYHHTFPWDYRAAELGMPFNLTTKLIDFMAKHGHVYDRKTANENMVRSRIAKTGDGTHEKYGEEAQRNDPDHVLRKYIVDKNEVNKLMMEQLEKYTKIEDMNNNKNKALLKPAKDVDLNEKLIKTPPMKNKQSLNVCSA